MDLAYAIESKTMMEAARNNNIATAHLVIVRFGAHGLEVHHQLPADRHNGTVVAAPAAVVGGTEQCQQATSGKELKAIHHALVRAYDHLDARVLHPRRIQPWFFVIYLGYLFRKLSACAHATIAAQSCSSLSRLHVIMILSSTIFSKAQGLLPSINISENSAWAPSKLRTP